VSPAAAAWCRHRRPRRAARPPGPLALRRRGARSGYPSESRAGPGRATGNATVTRRLHWHCGQRSRYESRRYHWHKTFAIIEDGKEVQYAIDQQLQLLVIAKYRPKEDTNTPLTKENGYLTEKEFKKLASPNGKAEKSNLKVYQAYFPYKFSDYKNAKKITVTHKM